MSYADTILPEFDHEMASTRKVLERVPDDKWNWRGHPKSNTIGWNANHLAEMVGWVGDIFRGPAFDVAPPDGPRYQSPSLATRDEVLELFDRNLAAARDAITNATDQDVAQTWSLMKAGQPIFTMPRSMVMRAFIINHVVHHRAILTVYLRLNDIPVPGLYGPSGDE